MIKHFVKILELLGDSLEVCVSVYIIYVHEKLRTSKNAGSVTIYVENVHLYTSHQLLFVQITSL